MRRKSRRNRKVVIVEDDMMLARMYKERLEQEGYEVLWAPNGIDAMYTVLSHYPDLIILDLYLPQRGGLGVLRILRSLPELRQIPVVVVTNYDDVDYRSAAERYGVTGFYKKTEITPGDLVLATNHIISERSAVASE
ncbi:MAG: Polar-differentiation response regulator DivK [bacterium ADurb.Bin400]|nr:MAG: Polar-differentiation response regulator DivK [bacterium ADurb.Bin400]